MASSARERRRGELRFMAAAEHGSSSRGNTEGASCESVELLRRGGVRTFGRWRRLLLRGGSVFFASYVGLLLLLAVGQRTLIYLPSRAPANELLAIASAEGLAPWRNAAGEIIGWHRPRPVSTERAANRVIVFHGNAGYALNRTHFIEGLEGLEEGLLWEVYLFEYPGFGSRAGSPSEESITQAALAAVESLGSDVPIYLVGESLGSGPASALAQRLPERFPGLLLVTPYSSLPDVAGVHYPFVPVRWLLRDQWDNVSALSGYPGRLGVILAAEDEVIPVAQGKRLYEAGRAAKRLWVMPNAGHNGLDFSPGANWWLEASEFLLARSLQRPRSEVGSGTSAYGR